MRRTLLIAVLFFLASALALPPTQATPSVRLVMDIAPGERGSEPHEIVEVGGSMFFVANDRTHGRELWRSDGTEGGTVLVKDIAAGRDSWSPHGLTAVDGGLYFFTVHGHRTKLWVSDGTEPGTIGIRSWRSNPYGSFRWLAAFEGNLFFTAYDHTYGFELWRSDGTREGTTLVKEIVPGPNEETGPLLLTVASDLLYFRAGDRRHGEELWRTDGTEAGTVMVKDIAPGSEGSYPDDLLDVDGTLYFGASDGPHGHELWRSDGTEAGTLMVKDIWPGRYNDSWPRNLADVDGTLYFSAEDATHGFELWRSDGTEVGTYMVKDILPGWESSAPYDISHIGGTLYFGTWVEGTVQDGFTLWTSDGTEPGTVMLKDVFPGDLRALGDALFFRGDDGAHGWELWTSDGTDAGTVMVADLYPGSDGSVPLTLTGFDGALYFTAETPDVGRELWATGG